MTRSSSSALIFAAALFLIAAPAFALKSDRDKPMDVNSDSFEGSTKAGDYVLTGHVKVTQGTMLATSDKAVITQDDKRQITHAVLTGNPAHLQQDLDDGGTMKARAKEIVYDLSTDNVVLTGDVVIDQPQGQMTGDKVTYDLNSAKITGAGEGAAGRVTLHILPQDKSAKPKSDDAGKKDAKKKDDKAKAAEAAKSTPAKPTP